jgi:hypothetical protein
MVVACGGQASPTFAPTQAPAATTSAPASTATTAPAASTATTAPPTEVPPTSTEPPAAATDTPAATERETVSFNWAPGSVPPADADDGAEIVAELLTHDGVLSGTGDENVLSVTFDPSVITVEEIMDILDAIGHPVVQQ